MSSLNFGSTSILNLKQFSYIFLADWLVVIIAILFVAFFLDRLVGFLLSQIIGWTVWRKHRVYFSVSSVKFSIFGGRIFFKNLVYIGENEAFSVLHGSYTWRYWLKRVRRIRLEYPDEDQSLPSRHLMRLTGVEWFIYNQSSAYDFDESPMSPKSSASSDTVSNSKQDFTKAEHSLFKALPITLEIDTFSIICGNQSTSTLMVSFSKVATIQVDVLKPTVSYDRYKLNYSIRALKPKIYFTANPDYNPKIAKMSKSRIAHWYSLQEIFANVKRHVNSTEIKGGSSPEESLEEDAAQFGDDTPAEHQKVTRLLDCDGIDIDYFYDVPDVCVKEASKDPECGYIVNLTNASINYGPWSERRRVEFYELFFPSKYKTYTPVTSKVGTLRQIPVYTTDIRFKGTTTLRIPTREFSKVGEGATLSNAAGENNEDNIGNTEVPYGWLELVVAENSSVLLTIDMLPQSYGFNFTSVANLISAQLRTSVNHAEMVSTDLFRIRLDQITPLQWNALQTWNFSHEITNARIFLLREHINLMVDLSEDLGSGQRIPYELFIPTIYNLDFNFDDIKLYVNVNPLNIISNPTSFAENVFLAFGASRWSTSVRVPFDQVSPVSNTITTLSKTQCLKMDIMTPTWHTLDAFLDSKTVGIAHDFVLSYGLTYYADLDYTRVEGHSVDIKACDFTLVSFGVVIDYLVSVIDNYGGVDFKFQTPEEFVSREFEPPQYSFTRNTVDVDYRITSEVRNASFVLPANLYTAKDNLNLFTESWTADLRFTNYYMDLQTEFSPVRGFINRGLDSEQIMALHGPNKGTMVLSSDELVVRSHRMFGLPPAEPTYVCKWDMNFGDLVVNIGLESMGIFPGVARSFAHGFSNVENRPVFEIYKPKDVTFVSFMVNSVSFKLVIGDDSVNLSTSMVTVKFHDLANERYSDKVFLDIPFVNLSSTSPAGSILNFTTSFKTTVFTVKENHKEHYEQQQEHIMLHDCLTHRCPFFLDKKRRADPQYAIRKSENQSHVVPTMSTPMMPAQLTRETLLIIDPDMGVFNYKGNIGRDADSDTASEESLYGSGIYSQNSTSSSDSSDDGSANVKKRVKAIAGEPENSRFLPPSEWKMPANTAKDVKSAPIFSVNAQEDQKISHKVEDGNAFDIISEVGAIVGTLHTDFVKVIQNALDMLSVDDVESLLDDLEGKLVDEIKLGASKDTLKVYLQIPRVNITVEGDGLMVPEQDISAILLELATVQVLGKVSSKRDSENLSVSKKFTTSFERVIAGVRTGGTEATRFDLSNPEVLFAEDDSGSSIDLRAGTLDFTTKACQLEELALFLKGLALSMGSHKGNNSTKRLENADLVYSILIAGQKAGIEHDPYVLSRTPAVQIKNNIRGDLSWRIMMRLRYLFNTIPSMEIDRAPPDAKKKVLEVLDNWRSWERVVPLEQSNILSEFDEGVKGAIVLPKLSINVESFSTVLKYNETQEDYFVFDEFKIHGAFKKPTDNWVKCLFGISAQRARLGITWDIIEVVRIVEKMKLAPEPHKEPEEPEGEQSGIGGLIFQAVLSLNIRDWSADLKAKSIKSEFQNKDLQFVTTVDYREDLDSLFASGVFNNSQAAIRTYSPGPKLELLDYLMENVSIGFSTNTSHLKGPLWLSVNVGYLNLAINATFEELCQTTQLILHQEYSEARDLISELLLEPNSTPEKQPKANTIGSSASKRALTLLLNVNLNIAEVVFRVQAMKDLDFVFSGTNIELSGRMPEEDALLLNLEWSAYVLRVMSEQSHCLGSFLVEGTNILARADLQALAFDIKYGVKSVNLETSSVLLTLRYMEKPLVVERSKAMKQALENTVAEIKQKTGAFQQPAPTMATKTSVKNTCWNYIFNIAQVRIFLPVDTFSFIFIFDEIGAEHKSFEWTQTGAQVSNMSYTHVNISEFSAQLRKGNDATKILSLQLLGSYQEVPDLSSIFFTSDFCRISLSPSTVGAMCMAFEKVRANSRRLLPEIYTEREHQDSSKLLDIFVGIKAAIALRNFSVDWLTEQSGTLAQGIIVGFELLQVNLVSHQCRMDLVGLAVTPKDSPWRSLEANKYQNYAHLPHVEIIGVLLTEEKYIDLTINGESLYVNMRPSVGILISSIINSVGTCRASLDFDSEGGEPYSKYLHTTDTVLPKLKASIDGKKSGLMDYSLYLKTKFEAASFKLWEDNLPDNPSDQIREAPEPSLELHSPDMITVIEYLHKESGRDCAFVDVRVSKSSNQVFPKALQEIKALFNYSTTTYGSLPPLSPKKLQESRIQVTEPTSAFGTMQGEVILRILKGVDATVRIKLDTQRLCVSCQPFSKLTTTVSTDMVELLLTTPITGEDVYLSLAGKVHGAKLSLRHAHSHGHSGYCGISEVDFTVMHKLTGQNNHERVMVGVNIGQPQFELRAAQIKDIGLFIDVWNPRRDTPEPENDASAVPERLTTPAEDNLSIGKRYRQLLAEFPMAWSVNITFTNLIGHADLGSALGKVKVNIDRAWSSIYRSGNIQQFVSGFDHIDLTCEGRLSADAKIKGISKRITVFWSDVKNVPLIQFSVDLNALDISLDIDGHRFLVGKATRWRAGFLNKLITITSGAHELFVSAEMDDISIAITSLVASNIYDVIEPLNFLRAQAAIYQKSLDRGGEGDSQKVSPVVNHILAKLRIRLSGQVNQISFYVFPTNFEDSSALKVRANLIKFVFDRKVIVQDILPSYLEIESYGIRVGLVGGTRATQTTSDFFKKLQSRAVSSVLVNIPHASVSMDSTDIQGKRVEYIFRSAFHGDVEVGWNLGTLNFIRELYETHERTWVSRFALKERAAQDTGKRRPQTIKEFMEEQRPEYVPTSTPEIHIPNLHDMGHATPPVEWVGFNRERLPGLIHWFAVRALNKMIGDIEAEYGKLLY